MKDAINLIKWSLTLHRVPALNLGRLGDVGVDVSGTPLEVMQFDYNLKTPNSASTVR